MCAVQRRRADRRPPRGASLLPREVEYRKGFEVDWALLESAGAVIGLLAVLEEAALTGRLVRSGDRGVGRNDKGSSARLVGGEETRRGGNVAAEGLGREGAAE